jgi:HK97 family phage prohead protease
MDQTNTATPPDTGKGQKFKFFTGPTKAYIVKGADGAPDQYVIEGIASSNVRDRYGDTMSAQCQASMLKQSKDLTMFGNHSYDVPGDVYGKCVESNLEVSGETIDLAIKMQIAQSNPDAMKSWELINKDGITLAFSIGGIILDAEIDDENDNGDSWFPPLIINDLELLEISLVGIPANPRSYTRSFIEDIKKSAFKAAQRDPGVTKALLKSIGVKSVDEDFTDLRDAEVVNDQLAAEAGEGAEAPAAEAPAVEASAAPAEAMPAAELAVTVETGIDKVTLYRSGGNELPLFVLDLSDLTATTKAISDFTVQRDAISTEITTKTSERDALVNEIAELQKKADLLRATPTGRQTKAHAGGTSTADVDLTKMTDAELRAHIAQSRSVPSTIGTDDV